MLINDDYRKVELTDPVDLIIIDIPYNIGLDAYASNPQWWKKGDFKNGKSDKAESLFFETDKDFNIEEMLSYIQKNLNRKFIGIEIEEKYFNIARSRLYGD